LPPSSESEPRPCPRSRLARDQRRRPSGCSQPTNSARSRESSDIADYPNPDLAIEVDISTPELDRDAIHAALQVAEVWRFDGKSLAILRLQPNGQYAAVESSRFLPVRADEVRRWVASEHSADTTAWERRLWAWVRDELAPRLNNDKAV
jgi:Uma2 family endonuclease